MTAKPELLPSGRYRATTWNAHSKRKGPTRTFDRESQAYAWARATEQQMDADAAGFGIEVKRNSSKPVTFAEYAATWTRPGPPSTRGTAASQARALARVWPTENLADITGVMVKAMLHDGAEKGWSAARRQGRLSTLRKIMTDAVNEGLRSDDPTVAIKGPKMSKSAGRHREITEDELSRILEEMPEWLHAAVLLSRDSGLRIGEVCGLPWHRVDLLHARVTVSDVVLCDGSTRTTPKGGKVYTVALTARMVAALKLHMENYPGGKADRVFREPGKGRPLVQTARVRELWQRARSAAGLDYPAPRWHDLRHSRGHALARAGAPIQVIQAILRHENIATTRVYMGDVSLADQARWMTEADRPAVAPVTEQAG